MPVARPFFASMCALVLCACPAPEGPEGGGGGVPSGRCEVDLAATGLFSNDDKLDSIREERRPRQSKAFESINATVGSDLARRRDVATSSNATRIVLVDPPSSAKNDVCSAARERTSTTLRARAVR